MADFEMKALGVDTETSLSGLKADGVLGMAPTASGEAQLIVDQMKASGLIDQKVFSVDLQLTSGESSIYFGGYEQEKIMLGEQIHWRDLADPDFWSVTVSEVGYGSEAFTSREFVGLLRSGASITYLPTLDFSKFLAALESERDNERMTAFTSIPVFKCESVEDFGDLKVKLGKKVFKMQPSQYIAELELTPGEKVCVFLIAAHPVAYYTTPTIVLGDSFLRNFYVIHDAEKMRVGIVLKVRDWNILWLILFAGAASACACVCLSCCVLCCVRCCVLKKRRKRAAAKRLAGTNAIQPFAPGPIVNA